MRTVISTLRRNLSDDADKPTYIFTEPSGGYRMPKEEATVPDHHQGLRCKALIVPGRPGVQHTVAEERGCQGRIGRKSHDPRRKYYCRPR